MSTPKNNIKLKDQAQARALAVLAPIGEGEQRIESTHYVEGYAARFEPYVLWEDEDGAVYECFDRGCFEHADMSDIILQYDHAGRVFARTGNGTLKVDVDENGLRMCADLSKTEGGRQLYEDIKCGMVTKMSWRFTCGDYDYDPETRTICHHTIKKVWDVSAVSIPANQDTEINARDFIHGEMEKSARRDAELDIKRRKLALKIKLSQEKTK